MTDSYVELKRRISEKQESIDRKQLEMKEQLKDIGVALKPVNLIKGAMGNAVHAAKQPSVLQTGIGLGVTFLADRLFLRKRGFILRTVGLFAVRKLVNKFTAKRST